MLTPPSFPHRSTGLRSRSAPASQAEAAAVSQAGIASDVAWLYREAGARGLITGSSGNVSGRTPEGMLITPSGADPAADTNLVRVTHQGQTPDGGTPSSETPMHAAIYATRPQAEFIVHTHADACTALACLAEPLPTFHYMVLSFGGNEVPCAPYLTFGTPALAQEAAITLRVHTACLLANHGMIVTAPSARAALSQSILLESLCRQYLMARAAGTPRLLTPEQMAEARERFKTYGTPAAPA